MTAHPTDFDPAAAHPLYEQFRPAWELNRDFAEMHLHVLRGGRYLDAFGSGGEQAGEPPAQYAWRRNAALALDGCCELIHLRVDNLFRTPPARRFDDSPFADFLAEFLRNVDGAGTPIDAFMRRALVMHYVNGVDFVVDKQSPPAGAAPLTLAQERSLGLLPYLHAFGPLERLDWACDHGGGYRWVRYDLGAVAADDETHATSGERRYLTLTGDQWRLYRVSGEGEDRSVTVANDPIALGRCPVVPFYYKESVRSDYPKVPLSLLTRVAPIARYLLNLLSQVQIDVYRNIAFLVATGVEADKIPAEITPMGCWALPAGSQIHNISGDVAHIQAKIELARTLVEAILRIGKLTGAAGELRGRATSGVQVAVERTDLDNEMRMTAVHLEQVERELIHLAVCRYKGQRVPVEQVRYDVEYNKKYVLTGADELIAQARELVSMGLHRDGGAPALLKILLRKVLDALAGEDDKAYADALAQIENASFQS